MGRPLFTINAGLWRGPLISMAGQALVTLHAGAYVIKPRTYGELTAILAGDYQTVGLNFQAADVLYAGAESVIHPNITVFPAAWPTSDDARVLPTSFGHYQADPAEDCLDFLEVYEVLSGVTMMVFDKQEEDFLTAVVGRKGEKLLSPNRAIHTIYNLNPDKPLVLLDFANSARHRSHKEIQKASGASLLMSIKASAFRVKLSPAYVNRTGDGFGVSLPHGQRGPLEVSFPVTGTANMGQQILDGLLSDAVKEQLWAIGIRVITAEEVDVAAALGVSPALLQRSLSEFTKTAPTPLRSYFFREDAWSPC